MGEIDGMLFWNIVLSLIVIPFGWVFTYLVKEVKRQQILINKTREEIAYNYARKDDVRDDITKLMDALHRLEDKLDKVLSK
jgi:hypothetical protein|tara:strand:- start:263 stop:505 length:243 start_codon:yes stop_codon:yes gene_type:complete